VQHQAGERRTPIIKHRYQAAGVKEVACGGFGHIGNAQAISGGFYHQIIVVKRQRSRRIDSNLLAALLELPTVAPATGQALTNAAMPDEIVRDDGFAETVHIVWGGNGEEAEILADPHRYHILRHRLAKPDARIEPLLHNVDKPSFADE